MSTCHVCNSLLRPLFQREGYNFWACTACGLECIFPQPDAGTLANLYRESYYDAWGLKESQMAVKQLKQGSFAQCWQILDKFRPGMRLLDCGASTGFLADLARAKGLDAYAIELSAFGAEACSTLLGADHVYEGEVEGAWFSANPENNFDIITMIDFIE